MLRNRSLIVPDWVAMAASATAVRSEPAGVARILRYQSLSRVQSDWMRLMVLFASFTMLAS